MSNKKVQSQTTSSTSIENINRWFIRIAFTFWVLFALLDYFTHNSYVAKAFTAEWHMGVVLFLFLIHSGFLYLHKKSGPDSSGIAVKNMTGWKIFIYLQLFFLAIVYSFGKTTPTYKDSNLEFAVTALLNVLVTEVTLFLLLSVIYALGKLMLKVFPLPIKSDTGFLFSIAGGFLFAGLALFAIAWFHQFNAYVLFACAVVVTVLGYKQVIQFFKIILIEKIPDAKLSWLSIIAVFVFTFSLALNLLAFFRPFPIGFDELQWYLNIPNLVNQSQGLIAGNSSYYWSLIMGVGFVAGKSIPLVSWLASVPGIIAALLIYNIARKIFTTEFSIVAAVSFYLLPTVVWHSSVDAKVDLALTMFFLSALSLLIHLFDSKDESVYSFHPKIQTSVFWNCSIWIGSICGFCLGIKYTSFVFLPAVIACYVYFLSRQWLLSAASLPIILAALFASNAYSVTGIVLDNPEIVRLITALLIVAGLALGISSFLKNRKDVLQSAKFILPLLACVVVFFSPWLAKNYSETKSFAAKELLMGKDNSPSLIDGLKSQMNFQSSENELSINRHVFLAQAEENGEVRRQRFSEERMRSRNEYAKSRLENTRTNTASYEEKERYTGYKKGIIRYVSILRDVCTQNNVASFPNDAGILIFVFIPLVLFVPGNKTKQLALSGLGFLILLIFTSISILSANKGASLSAAETVLKINDPANPIYSQTILSLYEMVLPLLTAIAAIFVPLYLFLETANFAFSVVFILALGVLLIYFHFKSIKVAGSSTRFVLIATGISIILWLLLGSGIVWYGLPSLAIAIVAILWFVQRVSEKDFYLKNLAYATIGVFFFISVAVRCVSYIPTYDPKARIHDVFIRYTAGNLDSWEAFSENNKQFAIALAEINAHPTAKVLRIGTFANYFISNNNTRVISDNQLESINRLLVRTNGKEQVNHMLKKSGIEYILYDLNSNAIDKTEQKTLTVKIKRLYEYLAQNPALQEIATDRLVVSSTGDMQVIYEGKQVKARYSVFGNRVIQKGTTVLFKLI